MATHERMRSVPEAPVLAAAAPGKPGREAACRVHRRSWRAVLAWPPRAGHGISLEPTGPVPGAARLGRVAGPLLAVAVTAFAAAQYAIGHPLAPEAWLAIAPLLASLALGPLRTTLLAGWTVLLGLGLTLAGPGPTGRLASSLGICGHPPPLRLSTDGELMPLAPAAFTAPLGLHPDLHLSTFSVRTGDRLLFFTDGLLEARDRAGRFFRVEQQIQALSRPDLQAAADELLDRL